MRNFIPIISLLLALNSTNLSAQGVLFQLDKHHSSLNFEVPYLGLMKQRGNFRQFDVVISYDSGMTVPLRSVTLVVQMTSVETNNRVRDRHLKSPDFLDAERYAQAIFQSKNITVYSDDEFMVMGELQLKGVSKQVSIIVHQTYGVTDDRGKNLRVGFEGSFSLDRTDFGIIGGNDHNSRFDLKSQVVGEQVDLNFSIQSIRPYYTDWGPAAKLLTEYEGVDPKVFKNRHQNLLEKMSQEKITLEEEELLQLAAFVELAKVLCGRGEFEEVKTLLSGIQDFSNPIIQRAVPLILEAYSHSGTQAELDQKIAQVLHHRPAHATALELSRN